MARYDEDVAWSALYWPLTTVYNKGSDLELPDQRGAAPDAVVRLPNVGRESHTYLHHVVAA